MENLSYKAFKQVGIVIDQRLKRYSGSKDVFGKELYAIYSDIFKCWKDIGFEKGYFQSRGGIGRCERERTPDSLPVPFPITSFAKAWAKAQKGKSL